MNAAAVRSSLARIVPDRVKLKLVSSRRPKGMKSLSRVVFFRSLACMVSAGVRLHTALALVARTTDDPRLRDICRDLARRVYSGEPLPLAMARNDPAFTRFQIQLVQVGFNAGGLERTLGALADYEEARRKDGMRVTGALLYPAFVFTLCMLLLIVGPATILSGQFKLLEGMHIPVPFLLTGLRAVSAFLCSWRGPALIGAGLLLGSKARGRYLTDERLRRWADRAPVVGSLLRNLAIAHFARSMAIQIRAGVMPRQALDQAAQTSNHPELIAAMPKGTTALEKGADLRTSLARTEFFPRCFLEILRAGEVCGRLDQMMEWLANVYQEQFDHSLDTALEALQPLVLMGTGIVTASVLLLTMAPMIRALQSL